LIGCGDKKSDPAATPTKTIDAALAAPAIDAAPAQPPPPKLPPNATLDGKPFTFVSAVAIDKEIGLVDIVLKNYPYTCKDATDMEMRSSTPDDIDMEIHVGRYLSKDGKLGWAVRGIHTTSRGKKSTVTMNPAYRSGGDPLPGAEIDPTAGAKFKIALDVKQFKAAVDDEPQKEIAVKSTIEVTSCGERRSFKKPPPPTPLEGGGTIEIAGQKLPIGGAAYVAKNPATTSSGSRRTRSCIEDADPVSTYSDVSVSLTWSKAGKLISEELDGYWIDSSKNQTTLKLAVVPNRPSGGAKEIKAKLGGSSTINGYPVALSGTVPVTVCPPKK
jgi:hypothetical protein